MKKVWGGFGLYWYVLTFMVCLDKFELTLVALSGIGKFVWILGCICLYHCVYLAKINPNYLLWIWLV